MQEPLKMTSMRGMKLSGFTVVVGVSYRLIC